MAIKLIFTVDLNPEIIHRVCKEAQLLSQINHPNVVEIFGVSVFPPSVCLVLEICHYGSLSDVIRGKGHASGKGGGNRRPPLPLTHADKMYLALGCARGLEALHSHSSTLCHRDVKSFNFLVDSQLNAKIADLELGGDDDEDPNYKSTTEKQFVFGGPLKRSPASNTSSLSLGDSDDARLSTSSGENNIVTQRTSFLSNRSNRSAKSHGGSNRGSGLKRVSRKLFGAQDKDEEFLCTWQAPEVMISAPHTQASDVYSLGLVFWEIISGLVPFENTSQQDDVRTLVLSGKRPVMPACADSRYVQLIKNCWKADWSGRPDIKTVVSTLVLCWEASVHRYLFATSYVCNLQDVRKHYDSEQERTSIASTRFSSSARHADDYLSRRSSLGKQPLSSAAAKAAAYLQNEPRLQKLQNLTEVDKSAYIILTPDAPHLVLWISKYIPKILGYFHNDLVCGDLSCICGPSTNRFFLRTLMQEASEGRSGHRLVTFYRRDGSQFINSLHVFPVFAQTSPPRDSSGSASQRSSLNNNVNNLNPFLQDGPPELFATSSTSPLPKEGYLAAINRSLEAAKRTTSEGRQYSPLAAARSSSSGSGSGSGSVGSSHSTDNNSRGSHENIIASTGNSGGDEGEDTPADRSCRLLEEGLVFSEGGGGGELVTKQPPPTPTPPPTIQEDAISSAPPSLARPQSSTDLKLDSILQGMDPCASRHGEMGSPERTRRRKKADSLDLGDVYESPSDVPTTVAYVILHFNVVQDLRT